MLSTTQGTSQCPVEGGWVTVTLAEARDLVYLRNPLTRLSGEDAPTLSIQKTPRKAVRDSTPPRLCEVSLSPCPSSAHHMGQRAGASADAGVDHFPRT